MTDRAIWLARHASTDWTGIRWSGRRDLELSDAGRAEAARLAHLLAPRLRPPVTIFSSPARRALGTARSIAALVGTDVTIEPDLLEVDLGGVDGLTSDEVMTTFPDLAAALRAGRTDIDWPDGERWADLVVRVGRVWARIEADPAVDLVVVAHGGLLGELMRAAIPGAGADLPRRIAPGSAIQLLRSGGWQLGERLEPRAPDDPPTER